MSEVAVSPATLTLPPARAVAQPDSARLELAQNIVRRRGLLATPARKLVAAGIASIVVHLVIGSFAEMEPPEARIEPLTARFMQLPPPPVAAPAAKPAPKPKAKTTRKPRPIVAAESPVALVAPEPEAVVAEALPANTDKPDVATEPVAVPVESAPAPAAAAEPPPTPAPTPARMPPKKIELAYSAFLGEQKFEVGPVNLKFTHDDGRYKLIVTGRGRGLAALLYPGTFTGESEGQITADGLRPDKFTEERGNPDKRREVIFDHVNKLLRIPEKDPIPFEGAPHDVLTWIVQFYFAMPKGETTTFSVGSTRRMDVYTLERTGEEKIESPAGEVMAQIWKGARKPDADGKPNGSATFWLVPAWHYVPFRIKVVNAQGRSASFDLTAVNTE